MVKKENILRGFNSPERAYRVDNYPYGFKLRTTIFYWIESKKKLGDRLCTCTINPKTGQRNKPKCSGYSTFKFMFLDEKGHVKTYVESVYLNVKKFEASFSEMVENVGIDHINPIQQANIRDAYATNKIISGAYDVTNYPEEIKPLFKEWLKNAKEHIGNCSFGLLTNLPPKEF